MCSRRRDDGCRHRVQAKPDVVARSEDRIGRTDRLDGSDTVDRDGELQTVRGTGQQHRAAGDRAGGIKPQGGRPQRDQVRGGGRDLRRRERRSGCVAEFVWAAVGVALVLAERARRGQGARKLA